MKILQILNQLLQKHFLKISAFHALHYTDKNALLFFLFLKLSLQYLPSSKQVKMQTKTLVCTYPLSMLESLNGLRIQSCVCLELVIASLSKQKKQTSWGIVQGRLNIWTEPSNCQILKNPCIFTNNIIPNIFLIFFMKLFFYAYKS